MAATFLVVGLVLAGLFVYVVLGVPSNGRHEPTLPVGVIPPGQPANANLSGPVDPPVNLTDGRWGVDVRADVALTSADAGAIGQTGATLVRWPGGALGDRFDPIANSGAGVIYNDNGTTSNPETSFAQFVAWCRSVGCESVVTLPAEIDDPLLAAEIVSYSLHTLDFEPTYWEIGNEPAMWMHFGIPWPQWNAAQTAEVTPEEFALLVQAYVTAIRSVDQTAPIVGLGGVGAGAASPSGWVDDVAQVDGPNLSALAIHIYPAGEVSAPQPLSTWFASLQGSSSLPARVNSTLAAMASSCPRCDLGLLVDEFATGTSVPENASLKGGYLAAYVGAELVQSLPLNLVTLDYYNLASGTPGAWFSASGIPSAAYMLYQDWHAYVGSYASELGVRSSAEGLLAAAGGNTSSHPTNLILVNTNATTNFSLDLKSEFPSVTGATIVGWNGSAPGPSLWVWGPGGPTNLTVPPMSLVMISGLGALGAGGGGSAHPLFLAGAVPSAARAGPGPRGAALLAGAASPQLSKWSRKF